MPEDKFYSKYYTYKNQNKDISEKILSDNKKQEDKLTKALKRAVSSAREPRFCNECNGKLVYKGLGHYICSECNNEAYTDYGKVRKVLDIQQTMNINELCKLSGLTKDDINRLVEEGELEIVEGKLRIQDN